MKWTDDDHTKAPYIKRSATDAPKNYRWITNRVIDPAFDLESCHEWPLGADEKLRRRRQWESHLRKQFGGIDKRTPAYNVNGKPMDDMEAVFVRKATDPPTETD